MSSLSLADANKLGGKLPPELGMLETMEYVSVSGNAIGGKLPNSICRLALLAVFEVGFNAITGGIPTCINQMSALYLFVVSNNVMTGKLPDGIGSLQRLVTFIADDNMFTGDVTGLFNSLPLLGWLHLEGNEFTGTITDDFMANQLQLTQIDISSNKFEGSIPAHLLSKPYLELIDLHDNRLTSSIPDIVDNGESDALLFLSIHKNSLTGVLPASLANLRNLNHLDGKYCLNESIMMIVRYICTNIYDVSTLLTSHPPSFKQSRATISAEIYRLRLHFCSISSTFLRAQTRSLLASFRILTRVS
jgi:hypothetical protein